MLTNILTFLLVVLTAAYVYLTYKISAASMKSVELMRQQILTMTRPYVQFDMVSTDGCIEARMWNSGLSAARNIEITTIPALKRFTLDNGLATIVRKPIKILVSGKQLNEFIGSLQDYTSNSCDGKYHIQISYEDMSGIKYKEETDIDALRFIDMCYIQHNDSEHALNKMAYELSKVVDAINSLTRKQ